MPRLLILVAFAACALAQSRGGRASKASAAPPADGKWPIRTLTVKGNKVFPEKAILAVAGLKVGQIAVEAEFDAARERLMASGAFETVGFRFAPAADGKGYDASFEVAETTALYPVKFEDLGAPDADVAAAISAKDPLFSMANLPTKPAVLVRDATCVEEYLAARGVRDKGRPVSVVAEISDIGHGNLVALFHSAKSLPSVARIGFEGNQIVAGSVLRTAIATAGIGSQYNERRFREILDTTVRPIYEARGRMRVSFPNIRVEEEKDIKGVYVVVTVDEGESYTLAKVSVGRPSPLPEDALLHEADIKTGDVANFDLVAAGEDRIRLALRRAGYLDAKVTIERAFDDTKKTADVTFKIDAGPRFSMGKLRIEGLDLDGEAEMRRIWAMKPGDAFNPEYPDRFLERVRNEAMFDHLGGTKAETKTDAKASAVDVTLVFTGDAEAAKKLTRRKI
jgi:outer membrane protein assembly factor BamA